MSKLAPSSTNSRIARRRLLALAGLTAGVVAAIALTVAHRRQADDNTQPTTALDAGHSLSEVHQTPELVRAPPDSERLVEYAARAS